jgi:hypothetical protein
MGDVIRKYLSTSQFFKEKFKDAQKLEFENKKWNLMMDMIGEKGDAFCFCKIKTKCPCEEFNSKNVCKCNFIKIKGI